MATETISQSTPTSRAGNTPHACDGCGCEIDGPLMLHYCGDCLAIERKRMSRLTRNYPGTDWRRICPEEYQTARRDWLPCQAASARVIDWQYGPRGLLLHGPTRTGKTYTAWLLIKRLCAEGRTVEAFDCTRFSHEVSRRFLNDSAGAVEWLRGGRDYIGLYNVDVVFLDDLGKERTTERAEAELFGLIENRKANRKPMIITMNMAAAEFAARLAKDRSGPLIARLAGIRGDNHSNGCCEAIEFAGADRRLK